MKPTDKESLIKLYNERFDKFGISPETLGWNARSRQSVRFSMFWFLMEKKKRASILDVGCGFADLARFLRKKGWKGDYCGVEINPQLARCAKENSGESDIVVRDITEDKLDCKFDYVFASGLFNRMLLSQDNASFVQEMLRAMHHHAIYLAVADLFSPFVDHQKDESYHVDIGWVCNIASKISRRFFLSHSYMPFEFMLGLYKDDTFGETFVFNEFLAKLDHEDIP